MLSWNKTNSKNKQAGLAKNERMELERVENKVGYQLN